MSLSGRLVLKGTGDGALPPMLEQYVQLRDQYADYLLLFQVGDFYEAFGEDAERLSRLLGITLTHKTSKDFVTPMAGIPIRALDPHVEKLLHLGVKVAIADQLEEPGGGLVHRNVTQLLTPGTLTEERLLGTEENYLGAVATGDGYALALLDVSTGEFKCALLTSRGALYDELSKHRPRELLLAPELKDNPVLYAEFQTRFPIMFSETSFEGADCEGAISRQFGRIPDHLDHVALRRACGAALQYASFAQQGPLTMVTRLTRFDPGAHMHLPESTLNALEVFKPNSAGSLTLLDVLSQTRTSGGKRRLRAWLRQPLLDPALIADRLQAVEDLVKDGLARNKIRSQLYRAHDLERLSARVSTGRATPREVAALARTLELLPELQEALKGFSGLLLDLRNRLSDLPEAVALIRAALVEDPPIKLSEGGLIRDGFHADLDALRQDALSGRTWMADLEQQERVRTGIGNLKVGYNQVFGYYLEVTSAHFSKIPDDYHQIATLKDRARFVRPDIRDRERQIAKAESAAIALETEVFQGLRDELKTHADHLSLLASAFSDLDVLCTLAEVAAEQHWIRPRPSSELCLKQARHPVVEKTLGDKFIPNDALMNPSRHLLVITGPNMAGKSTYLRMVALCALLHQIGSFVPAEVAELPLFDAIHTRIGASDDLAGGRSTFMVEMTELAGILHTATPRSLIILDEVGRGTSTLDGLAIAWSSLEHLQTLGAYTLYATHYFELTHLESKLPGVVNLHVAAQEEAGGLVFYHQVMEGAASESYGVSVAKLAGLPSGVTERADKLLRSFRAREQEQYHDVLRRLSTMEVSRLTPLEALKTLHDLQMLLHAGEPS